MARKKIMGHDDLRRSEESSAVIVNVNTSAYSAHVSNREKTVARNNEQDSLIRELRELKAQLEDKLKAEN